MACSAHAAGDAGEHERLRTEFLARGEAALAAVEVETALREFERAAGMRHSADSEMGVIRTYMQGGHYRRALAFGAHTAGAHRDTVGAAALYAWLLYLGGQRAAARSLIEQTVILAPGDPAVGYVAKALQAAAPRDEGPPPGPPARLAPYAKPTPMPVGVRVIGTGTLIDGGRRAVIPTAALPVGSAVFVRNGIGITMRGRVERALPQSGAAIVRLEQPLPLPEGMTVAARDPFPGSVAYAVEYVPGADTSPRWPLLYTGFAGTPAASGKGRALGIELPAGPRGGPVFDAQGQLVGVALPGRGGPDQMLLPSALRANVAAAGASASPPVALGRLGTDEIYERALLVSVQVLAVKRESGNSKH